MDAKTEAPDNKHTIPVIDRMMDILAEIERHAAGLTIRELTAKLRIPRTTIYRVLNTLQAHDVVRRGEDGAYQLGERLLVLAAHTSSRFGRVNLIPICQPFLDRLASELGEGVKLNVIEGDDLLVLAAAQGRREYALMVAPGQRMTPHSGASGKLILAFQPPEVLEQWLKAPLPAYTDKTITDPQRLKNELTRIRKLGWATDRGETSPSIHAFAAPVLARDGSIAAALSVPFLAGASESRMEAIREAVVRTAQAITDALKV
ncbi:transcriptional regulator, IclR family [Kaistia soli DSM 19436]|uniref:Transcriptional regulator, IclR family n=2 Tax=Kaistia TaxID=166953 RepID=A0A1M5EB82_9HYPH|nr:transcriptional regulator, IclR family [Kaistia soli DSM 19436]